MGGKNRKRKEEETGIRRRSIISWIDSWDCNFRRHNNARHNVIHESECLDDATSPSTLSILILSITTHLYIPFHSCPIFCTCISFFPFVRTFIYRRSVSHSLFVQNSQKSHTHRSCTRARKSFIMYHQRYSRRPHDDSGVSQDEVSSCLRRPCPFISVFFKVISRFYIWRRGVFLKMGFSAPWESGGRGVLLGGLYHMERL